jgi:two-component system, chemotaxis family, protein-glutamate methylesterase/glutaminase
MSLKVFVVDDTILFRTVISDALRLIPDVEVIGSAASGRTALSRIVELKPDLVTLDIEMPGMDGLQVLEEIKKKELNIGVIIVSSFTVQGGSYTIKALEKGAFDFITKPLDGNAEQNRKAVYEALSPRIKAFTRKKEIASILNGTTFTKKYSKKIDATETPVSSESPTSISLVERSTRFHKAEIVLIGVSTGGPAALTKMLPEIPKEFPVPIVIVQHMPPLFTSALAESLRVKCNIKVCEAANGDNLVPGTVYIAPGGKQMKIGTTGVANGKKIIITDDPPENNCKPSVDYLFRSAANVFPGKSIAVILTGMGSDGTLGLRLLKRHGCFVIAQDESTCVVYGMPRAAVEAMVVDEIAPLEQIASKIIDGVRREFW